MGACGIKWTSLLSFQSRGEKKFLINLWKSFPVILHLSPLFTISCHYYPLAFFLHINEIYACMYVRPYIFSWFIISVLIINVELHIFFVSSVITERFMIFSVEMRLESIRMLAIIVFVEASLQLTFMCYFRFVKRDKICCMGLVKHSRSMKLCLSRAVLHRPLLWWLFSLYFASVHVRAYYFLPQKISGVQWLGNNIGSRYD